MEPIESSETSAYINTLTPGTYPKENKLQSKHGGSLKSRRTVISLCCIFYYAAFFIMHSFLVLHSYYIYKNAIGLIVDFPVRESITKAEKFT